MIDATISCRASVNFPPLGWRPLIKADHFWGSYRPGTSASRWSDRLVHELVATEGEVAIVLSDAIARIPGIDPGWAHELREEGRAAASARPNGIRIAYRFPREMVRRSGLPALDALLTAFRQDALDILKRSYSAEGAVGAPERAFELSRSGIPKEWQEQFDLVAQKKISPTEGWAEKETMRAAESPNGRRNLMIVGGALVLLGAIFLATRGRGEEKDPLSNGR